MRLSDPSAPPPAHEWETIAEATDDRPAVRWQVRVLPPEVQLACLSRTAEAMANIRLGRQELADYGYDLENFGVLADPNVLVGVGIIVGACSWAEAAIVDWAGMQDHTGADLPLSRETIRAAMRFNDKAAGPVFLNAALRLRDGERALNLMPERPAAGEP